MKEKMLSNLSKSINLNIKFKKSSKENEDFKAYWYDPHFIELTKDTTEVE